MLKDTPVARQIRWTQTINHRYIRMVLISILVPTRIYLGGNNVMKKGDKLTRQAETRLVQVADRLVGLFGGRRLGRGGGGHGLRCDWHLAHRPIVQPSGYAPQLGQLWRECKRERKRDGTFQLLENRVWHHLASICKAEPYPAASFYPLVNVVGEGFSGHKAARALGVVKGSFLQDDLALADHHQGATADLSAFKNVVLHTLPRGNCEGKRKMCCKYSTFQA